MLLWTSLFFGKHKLTNEMIYNAEQFLLRCISNETLDSFDDLRCDVCHKKLQEFDLEMFLATISPIKQHILGAYLQCHLWLHAPFIEDILIGPLQYGYILNEDDELIPLIINKTLIPVDFPSTFNFLKCARPQGFSCCINQYAWSQYCKCKAKPSLKKNSSCWCKVN